MLKKCAVPFLLLILSLSSFSQNPQTEVAPLSKTPALDVYREFVRENAGRYARRFESPHYGIAVITQRFSETGATMRVALVGKDAPLTGASLEIQPVRRELLDGRTISRIEDGMNSGASITRSASLASEPYETDFEIRLRVGVEANALELKWTPLGTVANQPMTIVLPLETAERRQAVAVGAAGLDANRFSSLANRSQSHFKRVSFASQGVKDLSFPSEFAYCVWVTVSGSQSPCGNMSQCCANGGLGTIIDLYACTITCGTPCPRQEICDSPELQ